MTTQNRQKVNAKKQIKKVIQAF